MYFEEKRKTAPLEDDSRRRRMQLDASNMKIIAQLEKAQDGPQPGQPSQQVSLTPVNQRQV